MDYTGNKERLRKQLEIAEEKYAHKKGKSYELENLFRYDKPLPPESSDELYLLKARIRQMNWELNKHG